MTKDVPQNVPLDTIVVPAKEANFQALALGEHWWHSVRIHASKCQGQLQYIAFVISKMHAVVMYAAKIKSIDEAPDDASKKAIYFDGHVYVVKPVQLGWRPQNIFYTNYTYFFGDDA